MADRGLQMSSLEKETRRIAESEIRIGDPSYVAAGKLAGALRVVFLFPYGHAYSLMCNGPMSLYDLINKRADVPAIAERALIYDCLVREGNRLRSPEGEHYRSIESDLPVDQAHIIGLSVTNAGDLHSVFRLLDLARIPRRAADRRAGVHPLIVGGNGGFANPEILAEYVDVVAVGEAEESLLEMIRIIHAHLRSGAGLGSLPERLSQVPGLYVPSMYDYSCQPGGGVTAVRPRSLRTPDRVHAQFLDAGNLHSAHFVSPISDGSAAMLFPVLGCKHSCSFCTLGTPPFRQAPLDLLTSYVDQLEQHGIGKIIISAPTFTQYRWRDALLAHIRRYAERAQHKVTTIIGSVRADEISASYLSAVAELGEFGHLFTELRMEAVRGIITIAPEFAAPDLVSIYGKTMTPERVGKAIDLCRANPDYSAIMLYFIVGAPGERREDRLAIADYAKAIRDRLGRSDGTVILKIQQFMPQPGTTSQRLAMTDPSLIDGYIGEIRERLCVLAGQEAYDKYFRVLWGEASRLYLEAVCLRGDRRVGEVLEDLYESGADLSTLTKEQLLGALKARGLEFGRHLRYMSDPVLPWHVVNDIDHEAELELAAAVAHRSERCR
jgi:radical SAM superfamily enzyme YgiQ (UPF0313 family)